MSKLCQIYEVNLGKSDKICNFVDIALFNIFFSSRRICHVYCSSNTFYWCLNDIAYFIFLGL